MLSQRWQTGHLCTGERLGSDPPLCHPPAVLPPAEWAFEGGKATARARFAVPRRDWFPALCQPVLYRRTCSSRGSTAPAPTRRSKHPSISHSRCPSPRSRPWELFPRDAPQPDASRADAFARPTMACRAVRGRAHLSPTGGLIAMGSRSRWLHPAIQ